MTTFANPEPFKKSKRGTRPRAAGYTVIEEFINGGKKATAVTEMKNGQGQPVTDPTQIYSLLSHAKKRFNDEHKDSQVQVTKGVIDEKGTVQVQIVRIEQPAAPASPASSPASPPPAPASPASENATSPAPASDSASGKPGKGRK